MTDASSKIPTLDKKKDSNFKIKMVIIIILPSILFLASLFLANLYLFISAGIIFFLGLIFSFSIKALSFIALAFIALLVLLYFSSSFLLVSFARSFQLEKEIKSPPSVIFMLAGNSLTRLKKIESLNKQYKDSIIYISTPRSSLYDLFNGILQSELEVNKKVLDSLNIKYKVIPNKNGTTSTYDEAYDLLVFMKKSYKSLKDKSILIVTDEFHSRRAYEIFSYVFKDSDIKLYISSAKNLYFNESNWYKTEAGIRAYAIEFIIRTKNLFLGYKNSPLVDSF